MAQRSQLTAEKTMRYGMMRDDEVRMENGNATMMPLMMMAIFFI